MRAIGDNLCNGGVWVREEVSPSIEALGQALNQGGQAIDTQARATPVDTGT